MAFVGDEANSQGNWHPDFAEVRDILNSEIRFK